MARFCSEIKAEKRCEKMKNECCDHFKSQKVQKNLGGIVLQKLVLHKSFRLLRQQIKIWPMYWNSLRSIFVNLFIAVCGKDERKSIWSKSTMIFTIRWISDCIHLFCSYKSIIFSKRLRFEYFVEYHLYNYIWYFIWTSSDRNKNFPTTTKIEITLYEMACFFPCFWRNLNNNFTKKDFEAKNRKNREKPVDQIQAITFRFCKQFVSKVFF